MKQANEFCGTPREALELRRKLLSWWTHLDGRQVAWLQGVMPTLPGQDMTPEFLGGVALREQTILRDGQLFVVSDEMTEVARAAALTLPTFAIEREDFPCESGLIVFHHAPCQVTAGDGEVLDLVAATWWTGMTDGKYGVAFQWYEDRDGGALPPERAHLESTARAVNAQLLPRLTPSNWAVVPLGEDFGSVMRTSPLLLVAFAAFLLMQQPLAAAERAPALPLDGRRARRAGIVDTDVTVVKLRHLKHPPHGTDAIRPREYRHRWIVRGHWRNQWLPSRGVHRPTWISPHVKGPEDAPIKVTEKVNIWAR